MPRYQSPEIRACLETGLIAVTCTPWVGRLDHGGYGRIKVNGQTMQAHRHAWVLSGRELPRRPLSLDHTCHSPEWCSGGPTCPHRSCVTVAHLRIATAIDQRRNSNNGRWYTTHCKNGHPWVEENITVDKHGSQRCHVCNIEAQREWWKKNRHLYIDQPRTLCRKGLHPWTEENLYVQPNGQPRCRACKREAHRRWAAKNSDIPAD